MEKSVLDLTKLSKEEQSQFMALYQKVKAPAKAAKAAPADPANFVERMKAAKAAKAAKAKAAPAKAAPAKAKAKAAPANPGKIEIIKYSEKAGAVIGDTKPIKDTLKALNCRFNAFLLVKGAKVPGWLFSLKRLDEIKQALK